MMTVTFWFPIQTDRKESWATNIAKFRTVGGLKNLGATMLFKFFGNYKKMGVGESRATSAPKAPKATQSPSPPTVPSALI